MMNTGIVMNAIVPTAEMLFQAAYGAFAGDRACVSWGVHKGRNIHRVDTMGLTKEIVYDAAVHGDTAFFQSLYQSMMANPWQFPPSLRTLIPKDAEDPGKGTRPIDDPCELKRLVTLCVRHEIEVLAEWFMHSGQYGGRPAWAIKATCLRKGATMQDHVATAIWQGIRQGYRHVLVLDLKDAFGLLPERAAMDVLQDIALSEEAARWVWRLCQIDAVDARTRRIHYARQGRGIEQGNVLSATLMNLVLAPICRSIERSLDVRVISYLDDIYVLAPSHEIATEAFYRFRQSARDRGFTNVRRLKKKTDPVDSKNSTIINVEEQPVTVLKTYEVDSIGISLHPDKILKLRQEGTLSGKVSLSKLRKLSGCRSLTKAGCRSRNPQAIRPALQKLVNNPCGNPFSPVEGTHGSIESRDKLNSPLEYTDNVIPTRNNQNPDGPDTHDNQDKESSPLSSFPSMGKNVMSSRRHGAEGIPDDRDSHRPQGVTTPDRGRGNAGGCPAYLSVLHPDICMNLTRPGSLQLGNQYKGHILDLREIRSVLPGNTPVGTFKQVVNRLVKLVREEDKAVVVIDPREPMTAVKGILGREGDDAYHQTDSSFQEDGGLRITLVRRSGERAPISCAKAPDEAQVVIRDVRNVNRALNRYQVRLDVERVRHVLCFDASSPNDMAGALESLAHVLKQFPGSVVAVPDSLVPLLANVKYLEPSNVGIQRVVNLLAESRRWFRNDCGWLLGTPES